VRILVILFCALGLALVLSASHNAEAQCEIPPRLSIDDVICEPGAPCPLSVRIETGGAPIASLSARLEVAGPVSCGPTCSPGSATANGFCTVNATSCQIAVADLAPPITPFFDGEAARLTFQCDEPGLYSLTPTLVSFGTVFGLPLSGCGETASIFCGSGATTTTTLVEPEACGDANGDGSLVASDALVTLMTAVGVGDCPMYACDVDCSGLIAASDALIVLKAATGQDVTLDCACDD